MQITRRVPFILAFLVSILIISGIVTSELTLSDAGARQAPVRLSLEPCHLANVNMDAKCGRYEVFEDRASKTGRKINLNIVVLPSLSATPQPDPVFWLHGGPGAAATDMIIAAKNSFLSGIRKERDLVFVDQRGTGNSNPLKCDFGDNPADPQNFFGELFPRDKVRECREKLEKIANLKLYTTPIAMDDLDEVRDALGYDKINIVAGSYGTVAAQVYMRRRPNHIRAVFLNGVATPGFKQPLPFARGAQHALDLLFEDCATDEICRNAFPNLKHEFNAVLARFDKGPIDVELINPSTKQKQSVRLTRGNYVERLRVLLYTTTFARFVPLIVHKAYENDYLPFGAMAVAINPGSAVARGMYLTVTCSEGVPFITEQDIIKETKGTFIGDYRVRAHLKACKEWPKGDVRRSFIDPVRSNLPVLMISGEVDGATPPWLGEDAVKYLPNGHQVKIRYYGHQNDSPCVWDIFWKFIEKGSSDGINTTCTEKIRRPPFVTEWPKQFSQQ